MDRLAVVIESISEISGRLFSWLTLGTVLLVALSVFMRFVLNIGYAWHQELYVYAHAMVFMVGAAYTLKYDRHVRVDVLYGRFGRRYRAWVDLLGTALLLFPLIAWLLYLSVPYAADSWARLEGSRQSGGLPTLYVLKTVIPVACLLLLLQGIATFIRALQRLTQREEGL